MKKLIVCVCILLCLGTVFAGCTLFDYGDNENVVPLGTPLSVKYTEYQVIKGNIIKSINTTCEVKSSSAVKHSFDKKSNGKTFDKFNVKVGDTVKKNDVLCTSTNGDTIVSKINGVVRYLNSDYSSYLKGDKTIVSGTTMVVVDAENMDTAYGYVKMPQSMIGDYAIGVGSTLTMYRVSSSSQKKEFTGKIIGRSPEETEETEGHNHSSDTQNTEFFIDLSNATDDVKVGDRLSITYVEAEVKDVLMVPVSAVYSYNGRSFVYILDSQGLKKECYVETGLEGETFIEIKSGLTLGQSIIEY